MRYGAYIVTVPGTIQATHTHNTENKMQVYVKYPSSHHRSVVAPGWSPWGDQSIDTSESGADERIRLISNLAKSMGCQVRIAPAGAKFADKKGGGQ